LVHYKSVIAACRDRGIVPFVTFNHWTVPRWFAARGGWTNPESPALFAGYCDRAVRHLGAEIGYAATLNEPNGLLIAQKLLPPPAIEAQRAMLTAASRDSGVGNYVGGPFFSHIDAALPQMLAAHDQGRAAIKATRPDLPVGVTLAVLDDQADGDTAPRDAMRQAFYGAWLAAVKGDDFVGIQNYIRVVWGAQGPMPLPADSLVNQEGLEIHPPSLANCARYVHQATGVPIFVTEHGVMTQDDDLRARVTPLALANLQQAILEGVPVIGYLHWSLVDNFEWVHGYTPRYGLSTVDRQTFERRLKPSADILGAIARRNAL
jgi:beta-glucosidase